MGGSDTWREPKPKIEFAHAGGWGLDKTQKHGGLQGTQPGSVARPDREVVRPVREHATLESRMVSWPYVRNEETDAFEFLRFSDFSMIVLALIDCERKVLKALKK